MRKHPLQPVSLLLKMWKAINNVILILLIFSPPDAVHRRLLGILSIDSGRHSHLVRQYQYLHPGLFP